MKSMVIVRGAVMSLAVLLPGMAISAEGEPSRGLINGGVEGIESFLRGAPAEGVQIEIPSNDMALREGRGIDDVWRERFGTTYTVESAAIVIQSQDLSLGIQEGSEFTYSLIDKEREPDPYNLIQEGFDVFAVHKLSDHVPEQSDASYSYFGEYIVTATMSDAAGDINVAGTLTQMNIRSEVGPVALMYFSPVLYGDDLEALHDEAMRKLVPPAEFEAQAAYSPILSVCLQEAQAVRDSRIALAGDEKLVCYILAAGTAIFTITDCVGFAPWIPLPVKTAYCTALSAAYTAWEINACNQVFDGTVSYAEQMYGIDFNECIATGISPPYGVTGQVTNSCVAGVTEHSVSWSNFDAQPDYWEIWGMPSTPPFTPTYSGSTPGNQTSQLVYTWGDDYTIRVRGCKDGVCTADSSSSYYAQSLCN